MEQFSIFDMLYDKFKIDKPVRLIEFFAGIGSQAKALKNLQIPFEHHRICEWAIPSILAYNEIHHNELKCYGIDYSEFYTKDELINILYEKGISSNYNEPMKLEQIKRLPEKKIRDVYNAIISTNNLVNIQTTKGKDLSIVDKDIYIYMLTYSFPCQDLSLAGKRAGMSRDGNTRSGMLWEVERILKECSELKQLPQVLLMENVPQVCGAGNEEHFVEWQQELEKLGYRNYFETLNSKDYGIPQNRERCFMVSILGDYSYSFPKKIPLKLKLKDVLEDKVDEKYYLSDKMLNGMMNTTYESYKLENKLLDKNGCCNTIIARFDGSPQCVEDENNYSGMFQYSKSDKFMGNRDRFTPQKEIADCLLTTPKEGVVELKKDTTNYIEWKQKGRLDCDCRAWKEESVAPTTTTTPNTKVLLNNLRIRKLTPKECYRLMGFDDEDYENAKNVISDSMIYHTAGDSIVVNVLMSILKEMM